MRITSSYPALRTRSLCALGAPASTLATNRVPTHTPEAPYLRLKRVCTFKSLNYMISQSEVTYERAAARPRPSAIPPAATTRMGSPVSGLLAVLQRSTTAGIKIEKAVSPVWPPPSPPCAQIMSTPDTVHEKLFTDMWIVKMHTLSESLGNMLNSWA